MFGKACDFAPFHRKKFGLNLDPTASENIWVVIDKIAEFFLKRGELSKCGWVESVFPGPRGVISFQD